MQLKHLTLLAAAGLVGAQDNNNNDTQDLASVLSGQENLSNLTSLLNANPDLVEALGQAQNITILAPSDSAFAELNSSNSEALSGDQMMVAALLQYHVLNGSFPSDAITNQSTFVHTLLTQEMYTNVTDGQVVECMKMGDNVTFYSGLLQNTTVTTADVSFGGGVIHVVDSVLTLPTSVLDTANSLDLTAFRGAVNASDSIEAIANTPDLTIFAPDNEAFQSISSALQNASSDDLASILSYHVVNGSMPLYSSDLMNGTSVQTLNGANITVRMTEDGSVFVNSAEVTVPNVLVANGVIHIIDNVLNPDNTTATPSPSATEGAPGFTGSMASGTDVPFTSGQPTPTSMVNPTQEGAGGQSSTTGAAMPMKTGSVGAAALFGAAGAVFMGY